MIPGYLAGAVRDRPESSGYTYRARAYPWAQRVLARSEQVHGQPQPTCVCGGNVTYGGYAHGGICDLCGRSAASGEYLTHGTDRAWRWHLRRSELPCDQCQAGRKRRTGGA